MFNIYERAYQRESKKERVKGGYRRQLSNYEKVLQDEIFTLPVYEIENYLEACPYIVKKHEFEVEVANRQIHDNDPDELDLIAEYGEDPYDDDGDFSDLEADEESLFFITDTKATNRLSIGQSKDRCAVVFTIDETGHWDVTTPISAILRFYEPLPENPYEGEIRLYFVRKKYDILLKISKYLASLIEQKKLIPSEKNRKYFFLYFPEFTAQKIIELDKENIHKSTLSNLQHELIHIPIIGELKLGEILDITKNAMTHGQVINLIDNEDKMNPLKDTELAEKVGITERTIKNIRNKYGILNVYQRKKQRSIENE